MQEFNARAQVSILKTGPVQRALGRMVTLQTPIEPAFDGAQDLGADMFHSLHSAPDRRSPVPAEREMNGHIMDWLKASPEWESLAATSKGNIAASKIAAQAMYALTQNDEVVKEAMQRQEEAQQAEQAARDAEQQARMSPEDAQAQQAANAARENAEAVKQVNDQFVEQAGGNKYNQAVIRNAVHQATEAARDTAGSMKAWGMGSGSPAMHDPAAALDFLKRNSDKIKAIAKIAGRMKSLSTSARRSRTNAGPIPTDIVLTQEIEDILPDELARLSLHNPERIDAIMQWQDIGLLGMKKTAERKDAGPFGIMLDTSASMAGNDEILTKGLSLGLAQTAKSEKRKYWMTTFSYHEEDMLTVESSQDWQAHLAWGEFFPGGGTNFDLALRFAAERMKAEPNSDLLFITDGVCHLSQAVAATWKKLAKDTGTRLFFVTVGIAPDPIMRSIADKIIRIDNLNLEMADVIAGQVGAWLRP